MLVWDLVRRSGWPVHRRDTSVLREGHGDQSAYCSPWHLQTLTRPSLIETVLASADEVASSGVLSYCSSENRACDWPSASHTIGVYFSQSDWINQIKFLRICTPAILISLLRCCHLQTTLTLQSLYCPVSTVGRPHNYRIKKYIYDLFNAFPFTDGSDLKLFMN